MATVVQSSADLVASLEQGKVIEPADVIADREGPKTEKVNADPGATAQPASKETPAKPEGEVEDFARRYGFTEEQHKAITSVVDKAVKQAVGRTTRQKKEAEEFAEAQAARVRELEGEVETLKKSAPEAPKAQEKPVRANFKTEDEYHDALVEFRVKEQLGKERREAAEKVERDAYEAVSTQARERLVTAKQLEPEGWEETENFLEKQQLQPHIGDYLRRSEKIAELSHFFAHNPKEFERIQLLPVRSYADVMRVGVELDKISATLKSFAPAPAAKQGSKASNGATPSQETESGTQVAAETAGTADPSTETESDTEGVADPSEPRDAPVIRPLTSPSASQVEIPAQRRSVRQEIAAYQKKHGGGLMRRKRH